LPVNGWSGTQNASTIANGIRAIGLEGLGFRNDTLFFNFEGGGGGGDCVLFFRYNTHGDLSDFM